jgi:signal transduction histidine kinase
MKAIPLELIQRVRRSIWTLPLAALAALVIFGINEAAYDRSTRALTNLGDRAQARAQIQQLWRALIDAETGQRGYLLTDRKDYLLPYQRAGDDLQMALDWLGRYYRDDPEAEPVLQALRAAAEGKMSELRTTLQLHDAGPEGAWRDLLLTDIGREKMDGVRAASSALLELETRRIGAERGDVFTTLRSGRFGVGAMTLLSLLALFLFLRQSVSIERVQRQHAAALKAERDRLEVEAARRTADLTELARHLQTAREDERSRLARELHDELGALLTAAKLDAARLKRAISTGSTLTPDVQERLAHLNESINRGIELKRRIIEDLRPSSLSNLGLVAALDILTRDHASRSDAQLHIDLQPVPLSDSAQITVYRLVQEALTNITKHAQASAITVTLQPDDSGPQRGALVVVQDDGIGFDPHLRHGTTHGLMGMRYRVEAEGGVLSVQAEPGAGTRLQAWLPRGPELPEPVRYDTAFPAD